MIPSCQILSNAFDISRKTLLSSSPTYIQYISWVIDNSWLMPESPGLKLDWFDEISLFSIKKLNVSLNINLLRIFPQISNNDTERWFSSDCLLPFLWMETILAFFHSEGKTPVSMHYLNIIFRGLQMEEPHFFNMRMLKLSWRWALFGSKFWIILAMSTWEKLTEDKRLSVK